MARRRSVAPRAGLCLLCLAQLAGCEKKDAAAEEISAELPKVRLAESKRLCQEVVALKEVTDPNAYKEKLRPLFAGYLNKVSAVYAGRGRAFDVDEWPKGWDERKTKGRLVETALSKEAAYREAFAAVKQIYGELSGGTYAPEMSLATDEIRLDVLKVHPETIAKEKAIVFDYVLWNVRSQAKPNFAYEMFTARELEAYRMWREVEAKKRKPPKDKQGFELEEPEWQTYRGESLKVFGVQNLQEYVAPWPEEVQIGKFAVATLPLNTDVVNLTLSFDWNMITSGHTQEFKMKWFKVPDSWKSADSPVQRTPVVPDAEGARK